MLILYKNDAGSKLSAGITAVQTTLSLTAGHGAKFPQPVSGQSAFWVTVEAAADKERMLCTARSGDVLTVTRGQGGTTAAAFLVGALVELRANAELMDSKLGIIKSGSYLQVYVDPSGNDTTGTGTLAAPYATIAKAIDTVRYISSDAPSAAAEILLGNGAYLQTVPLNILTHLEGGLYIQPTLNQGALTTTPTAVSEFGAIRANSTAYTTGKFVIPATPNGFWYECTTAGTSAAAPPGFGTTVDGTTTDGTLVWTCRNYHDVRMTHSTVNAPTFIVGRYLYNQEQNLFYGTHKVIAVGSGTVTYRVYDYAARVIEATPVAGIFYARNVVIYTNDGTPVIDQYNGYQGQRAKSHAYLGQVVIDGTDPALGGTGYQSTQNTNLRGAATFVNLYAAIDIGESSVAFVAVIANCNFAGFAYGNGASIASDIIHGCSSGPIIGLGAALSAPFIIGCGVGADVDQNSYARGNQINNCTTGLKLKRRSGADYGTIKNCGTGLTIIGGSYAEVTTFTGNTTNSDLAVNTVGNANSYVKN